MARKPLATINVTPLVDVLLILMVILMVAMPLFAKKLPVSLPKTSLDAAPAARNTVKVGLGPHGEIFLNGQKVNRSDALLAVTASSSVELYPDATVPYSEIAGLVADVSARKPQDLALITQ
jgi:biopolymer transport protein TolR